MTNVSKDEMGHANPRESIRTRALMEEITTILKDLGGNNKHQTDEGRKMLFAAIVTTGALIRRFAVDMNTKQLKAIGREFIAALKRAAGNDGEDFDRITAEPCIRAIVSALAHAGGFKLLRRVPELASILYLTVPPDPDDTPATSVIRSIRLPGQSRAEQERRGPTSDQVTGAGQ